jgi:hypothetical protein
VVRQRLRDDATLQGTHCGIDSFEQQGFIKAADGDRVEFEYRGIHTSLLESVSRRDVVWMCELMSRLSDSQWQDAFRAAGYTPDHADRYIRRIKAKMAEGLALAAGA